jgi:hypothetical protein
MAPHSSTGFEDPINLIKIKVLAVIIFWVYMPLIERHSDDAQETLGCQSRRIDGKWRVPLHVVPFVNLYIYQQLPHSRLP